MIEVGKKYNERTLYRMRKFYEMFSDKKMTMMWPKLSWSHYREVLSLKDINEIKYYLNECESKNLTIRQLQNIIKNREYDRLNQETKNKLIECEQLKVDDLIQNSILVKVNTEDNKFTEYALKQAILNNFDKFLLQLGNGFTYVGNEYKI